MIKRLVKKLHPQESGKYACYLCLRGSDSYLEATAPRVWIDDDPKILYTYMVCRSCLASHGIDTDSEWDEPGRAPKALPGPAQELPGPDPEQTPELYLDWAGNVP